MLDKNIKISKDILLESKKLFTELNTWADLSNAIFDPLEGLIVKKFPSKIDRDNFRKSGTYSKLHILVKKKMKQTGVINGSTPEKIING